MFGSHSLYPRPMHLDQYSWFESEKGILFESRCGMSDNRHTNSSTVLGWQLSIDRCRSCEYSGGSVVGVSVVIDNSGKR